MGYTDGTIKIKQLTGDLNASIDLLVNVELAQFDDVTLDLLAVPMTATPDAPLIGATTSVPSVIAPDATSFMTAAANEDGDSVTVDVLASATNGESFVTDVANNLANLPAGVSFDALANTLTLDPSNSAYQDLSTGEIQTVTVYYGLTESIDNIAPVTTVDATFTITGTNDAPVVSAPVIFNVQEDLGIESVAPLSGEVEVETVETEIELELKDLAEKDSLASGNLPNSINLLAKAMDIDHLDSLSVVDVPTILPSGVKYIHLDAQTIPSTLYYGAPTVIPAIDALVIDPSDAAFQNLAIGEETTLTINYGVSDGLVTTPTTAIFNITGTNDAPLVSGLLSATPTQEGGEFVAVDALALASDVDHNAMLSVTAAPPGGAEDFGGLTEIENPADDTVGSLILSTHYDGTAASLLPGVTLDTETNHFSFNSSDPVYEQLSQGEVGRVVINYGVTDGIAPVATSATALFTLVGSNDAPVVSGTMTHTVLEGEVALSTDNSGFDALEIEALEYHGVTASQIPDSINLLSNASDVDHLDKLSIVNLPAMLPSGVSYIHTEAYSSSVDYFGTLVEHPTVDALIIDSSDISFQSLAEGDVQTLTIDYGVSDGIATIPAQAVFTVIGTNDAPTISVPAGETLLEDAAPVTVDALTNAIDVDHDAVLSIVDVPVVLPAGIRYDSATHGFSIDATDPVFQELAQGEMQSYSVGYGVTDGMTTTLTHVNFNVVGVNDAPIISGSVTGSPNEDGQTVSVNATGNAVDVDAHQGLQVTDVPEQLPAGVSYDWVTNRFSLDPTDAAYQYLSKGETVDVSIAYNVFDGYVNLPTSVIFTVTGKNDVPVSASVQGGYISENDAAYRLDLLANTTDVDHLDLLAIKQGQGTDVTANISGAVWSKPINFSVANNQLTIDPAQFNALRAGENVDITFSYTVTDGNNQGDEVAASAVVTLVGANDAPVSMALSSTHVIENTMAGTSIAELSTVDSDRNETFTYQLVNDPKGLFAIKGNALVVAAGAVIDYEIDKSDSIQVQVTDSAGASLIQAFTIGIDNVSGTVISTSSKNDVINAASSVATTSEEDTVDSKNGNDTIYSLAGNDTLTAGAGNDNINAGEGDDTIMFAGSEAQGDIINAGSTGEVKGDTVLIQGKGSVTLTNFSAGLSSIENWRGNGADIAGTGSADKIDLSYLKSLTGLSFIDGGSANDAIVGSIFADDLRGNSGNDNLSGGAGDDNLNGGAGNDTINGSLGNDTLTGGTGIDSFVFKASFGKDTISDFVGGSSSGHDIIDLDQTLFANFAAVQAGMSQVGANVVIISNTDVITLVGVSMVNVMAVDFAFH